MGRFLKGLSGFGAALTFLIAFSASMLGNVEQAIAQTFTVQSISISGNQRIEDATILSYANVETG